MDDALWRALRRFGVPALVIAALVILSQIGAVWAGVEAVQKFISHLHLGKLKIPPPVRPVVAFLLTSPWVGIAGVGLLHVALYRRIRWEVKHARRVGDMHEHDNVLWADTGRNDVAGVPIVVGPFCPHDRQVLFYQGIGERGVAIDSNIAGAPLTHLFCQQCQMEFRLGARMKLIGDSRREVAFHLHGRRIARR